VTGKACPQRKWKKFSFRNARVHALVLLSRRLQGLFGRLFQLEVQSEAGQGTTVTLRISLRFEVGNARLDAACAATGQLAPG
jgi:LytS/YehU family sensor histidine kinase